MSIDKTSYSLGVIAPLWDNYPASKLSDYIQSMQKCEFVKGKFYDSRSVIRNMFAMSDDKRQTSPHELPQKSLFEINMWLTAFSGLRIYALKVK